jgi:ornithine cyclodeaminase
VNGKTIAEDSILELGNVIKNPELGRSSDEQITVVDLTGVAIQDIQIAKMVSDVQGLED